MRVSRRGAGIVALAALLLPAMAHANELLVMPYACTMVGGQPLLTPGPEQGHRVLGPRDQRKFSACSPVNPDMCRQWTVHRFDLDCDGARVPWASVVAATNEGSRRAWLLDGRLVLRMGPRWSLSADDPCAQERGPEQRFEYRRMRRYCTDRLAMAPPPIVEMPFGYAPMLGIDGIFVKGGPTVAGGTAATPGADPSGARLPPRNPMPELFPDPQPAWPGALTQEEPAGSGPGAQPQAVPPQSQPPPRVAATAPSASAAAPPVPPPAFEAPKVTPAESKAAAPEAKPASKAAPGGPPPKTVTDIPATPPASAPPPVAAAPRTAAAAAKPAAPEIPKVAAASPPNAAEPPAAVPAAEPVSGGAGINLLGIFRTTTVGALVAFGGLALGLITAFALARRNESIRDAGRRPRDLGSVSLGDKRARPPARIANARGSLPPNAAASAVSRVPGQTASANGVTEWGDRMPQTRAEAMQVLGIGVAPTATEAAIKKVVDGLRQSWHPDHAKDEADRAMRELRSKQINAAWELLRQQRAMV